MVNLDFSAYSGEICHATSLALNNPGGIPCIYQQPNGRIHVLIRPNYERRANSETYSSAIAAALKTRGIEHGEIRLTTVYGWDLESNLNELTRGKGRIVDLDKSVERTISAYS